METADTEIVAHMERGIGVEIVMTCLVPCFTHMEDSTRPYWSWISNWMDVSVEHSIKG